jgi:hypothetical protein
MFLYDMTVLLAMLKELSSLHGYKSSSSASLRKVVRGTGSIVFIDDYGCMRYDTDKPLWFQLAPHTTTVYID